MPPQSDLEEVTQEEIREIDPSKYSIFPLAAVITVDGILGNGRRWKQMWESSPPEANFCVAGGRKTHRVGGKRGYEERAKGMDVEGQNITDVAVVYGVMDKETLGDIMEARASSGEE